MLCLAFALGAAILAASGAAFGCGHEATSPPAIPHASVSSARLAATRAVDFFVDEEVRALRRAVEALCAADDVAAMRSHWRAARVHYERIEGAIAVLFPHTDRAIDDRYEHVVELRPDPDPLDGHGFVGMHAVERLLWAGEHPAEVVAFEAALTHSAPAEAIDAARLPAFRSGLCARLVADVVAMERELDPVALDPETAWRGVLGSVEEQAEKVRLGTTGQAESRYARHTLADMRANLEGGRAVLAAFREEIEALSDGPERHARLVAGFARLQRAYDAIPGDDLPPVPDGFDPDAPSEPHLSTPYGRLFSLLARESDRDARGSLAWEIAETGRALGIAELSR